MLAEIITIGDEILIGQIVDSNSAYLASALGKIGIAVRQINSISDQEQHILDTLLLAKDKAKLILITGGLGPTNDDRTKHALCNYFQDVLVKNEAVWEHIQSLFAKLDNAPPLSKRNQQQAFVPSKAKVLMNAKGTAPGLWFESQGIHYIALPGVPTEMKALFSQQVIPRLMAQFDLPHILHKTVLVYGVAESLLAEKLEDWENNLSPLLNLAYLPNFGRVRLRLTAKGTQKEVLQQLVEKKIAELQEILGDAFIGEEGDADIEVQIADLLIQKNNTLSVVESCTGGAIATRFTANPGASNYFKGSMVTYASETKQKLLGLQADLLQKHSVTSHEVAQAMAREAKKQLDVDYAISTTGNAGPTKGDGQAEIGTVYIGLATPDKVLSKVHHFGNDRYKTIQKATNKALVWLFTELSNS